MEFKITENKIEELLQKFESGEDHLAVLRLYDYAFRYKQAHEQLGYDLKESLGMMMLDAICLCLKVHSDPIKAKGYNIEARKRVSALYREYLSGNIFNWDLQSERNKIGIFHVHYNASKPSSIDIDANKKKPIPNLVISANPDYAETGVKLYLIHSGSFELLYDGLLTADKK
ncbi:MAG: hypothetical protein AABX05_04185 [Nanoarchaeota archaeon]